MQPTLCSRCKTNMAVIFISKVENGVSKNEGLCLKCARELHVKPMDDIMAKMGITDEDLETLTTEMTNMLGRPDAIKDIEPIDDTDNTDEDIGKTATFPYLNRLFGNDSSFSPMATSFTQPPSENGSRPSPKKVTDRDTGLPRAGKRKYLDNYCIDLTAKARNGQLDNMIGREEELERVIQILNRRQKNNPCLIGEPGVGKTAIAEGLSQRISCGEVPYKLRDKEVMLLDLTSLVAGTQFRGQFESRMKGLIEEIRSEGNIILVIDEIHNIVGAGDAEGSMNAANILKPALSRGEIQVIGATTFTEYRKHIEKDSALERRFQPVTVAEPSLEDSVTILKGIKHYYEDYHGVEVTDDMCRRAVTLSERYITDRYLPDKAIDLIDEACSDVNLKSPDIERAAQIAKELADLDRERDLLLADTESDNYERLAAIRSTSLQLTDEHHQIRAKGRPKLTEDNLARVIELWTKIPASNICEDEYDRLSELHLRLKKHIIGQDEAVDTVCAAIKRNRIGLSAKHKPVSFIFVGSTGVGKTERVKRLSADLFNTPESLIRLDMSEFMEKHSVSRIIGSPPGYVGYDEAGQLTEKIRRKPYSVVLFDEIEKAHPDVMNVLLQILDDGRITDAQGRTVNFENTVIIMTTNAGSDKKDGTVGFGGSVSDQGKEKALKALKEFLRPEFINRVDEIVYFSRLTEDNFREIAKLMLKELVDVMAEKDIALSFDESLIDYLSDKSYSLTYGARNLRRLIQKEVEDTIAAEIIDNHRGRVSEIHISSDGKKVSVTAK
jgi:ATP-dependent Clp protease ATP-binding subunit ClpC